MKVNQHSTLLCRSLVTRGEYKLAFRVMYLDICTEMLQISKERHNRRVERVRKQTFELNADVQASILRWGIDIHEKEESK